jgi:hypothetical protein
MLPPRDQTAVGLNVTVIVHDDPAATVAQLLVCEKSPVAIMLLIVRSAVPVLLIVIACGVLLDPTNTPLKLRPTGDKVAAGATPAPLIATVCGLPAALSVTFTSDDRLPDLVGVNVTLIVQLALAARDPGQVLVCEKSELLPVAIVMFVKVRDTLPVFVNVTTCGVLPAPTCWLPKLRLVGDKLTTA